ncbi:MAG: hypothetical protein AMXMBFR25_27460 [Lysobacterales bacterium]|nr:hypothetical protein [Xanthomonadales bacterium]
MRVLALLSSLIGLVATADARDWQIAPGGNVQYDWLRTDQDGTSRQWRNPRRTRLSAALKSTSGIDAKLEFDVHANTTTDAFLRWRGGGHAVRIGQYKQPMFLDELTPDRYTLFMEQGLPAAFALARRLGLEYSRATATWRYSLSAFDGNLRGSQEGAGVVARVVHTPWVDAGRVLHLGLSAASESPDGGLAHLSSRVEQSGIGGTRLDTGSLVGVERIHRAGVEALWIAGPWTLQGEYLRARLSRRGAADADFSGWYLQAGCFVGGDRASYRDGAVDAPELGEDGRAFELAMRISDLDLNDAGVRGGKARNLTLGANWHLGRHLRLTANFVRVDGARGDAEVSPNVLEARLGLSF